MHAISVCSSFNFLTGVNHVICAYRRNGQLFAVEREEVATKCSLSMSDFDWLVPHQANIRIMEATARKLGISANCLVSTVREHGNTSAVSIPLALDQAYRNGRICRGDKVLMHAVGAGVTWGALAMQA